MATKPEMIVMPAHPTNTWDRYGQPYEFIVMHYVGGVSTARNNGDYYGNTPYIGASAHYFVDEHDIVYSCPLDRSAGHCGVDYSGGKARKTLTKQVIKYITQPQKTKFGSLL